MSEKNLKWWEQDPEELKKLYGYEDLSKNLNALPIPLRKWDRLNECVVRNAEEGKPYALVGYVLKAIQIVRDNEEPIDIARPKPNVVLAFALQENFCGKKYLRYEEGKPPLILRLQKNKLLISALRELLFSEEGNQELRKKPVLLEFWSFNPIKKGAKPFTALRLKNAPSIDKLDIAKEMKQFLKALKNYDMNINEDAKVIVITQSNFEQAYRDAFGERLEKSQILEEIEDEIEDLELEL